MRGIELHNLLDKVDQTLMMIKNRSSLVADHEGLLYIVLASCLKMESEHSLVLVVCDFVFVIFD